MNRLAQIVTRHPWRVLLAWLVAVAALVGLTGPGSVVDRADVMETDQAAFLPERYESARAAQLEQRGFPTPDGGTATLVVRRSDGRALTSADIARASALAQRVDRTTDVDATFAADAAGLSPNRKVLLGAVQFERTVFDPLMIEDVRAVRDRSAAVFEGSGLTAGYAGRAPTQADASERESLTSMLTLIVIALLLVMLFRSLVMAFFDVVLIGLVGAAATGAIIIAAKAFGFSLDTNVTGLLPIVVLGVGTDYVVFLLHRYRERLRAGDAPRAAMHHAITRIGPAIGFSALAVVVSLSALLLSSMSSFRVLGPALGFGVLATLLAALTLVPAAAVLLKRGLFWPSRERAGKAVAARPNRVASFVTGKPVGALLASGLVLVALAVPALGFKADYDVEATVSGSPSERAFHDLEAGFPQGALEPTKVLLRREDGGRLTAEAVAPVAAALARIDGVGNVRPAVLSADGRTAQVQALLDVAPFGNAALDVIERRVRPAVHAALPEGIRGEVGGTSSAFADVRDAIAADQKLIFPVAALLVALILALLLRSIAVPVFVMAGVALGFVATLGASVALFQGAGGEPGLVFTLPLVVYLFVASMVSDYAILVLSRVREELADGRTSRDAVAVALRTAGPSVVAAGVVLAASFGVLVISPSLSQVGFAVGFGILLSAVLTARVFIPALTILAGRRGWWPSRFGRATVVALPARAEQDGEEARAA
jgi:putative drug exporter of the RND superfamily